MADCAGELEGVLGEGCEVRADLLAGDCGEVEGVDFDGAGAEFEEAEESEDQGGFAAAGAAADADSLAGGDGDADVVEDCFGFLAGYMLGFEGLQSGSRLACMML